MNDAPNQISKKELLEQTGISYGQLYRWKRKGLIPEAWFVKKSAFTGQETFFPRREILARIEQIKGMKDDLALSDLLLWVPTWNEGGLVAVAQVRPSTAPTTVSELKPGPMIWPIDAVSSPEPPSVIW